MICHSCRTDNRGPQTVYPIVVPELGNGEQMNSEAALTLPDLRAGRHWEVDAYKSTPRKRTADRALVRLYARTGRLLGYFAEYDNGWGINVATSRGFKSAGGVYTSGERAAAALLKELAR